jgi:hypothetical protein
MNAGQFSQFGLQHWVLRRKAKSKTEKTQLLQIGGARPREVSPNRCSKLPSQYRASHPTSSEGGCGLCAEQRPLIRGWTLRMTSAASRIRHQQAHVYGRYPRSLHSDLGVSSPARPLLHRRARATFARRRMAVWVGRVRRRFLPVSKWKPRRTYIGKPQAPRLGQGS